MRAFWRVVGAEMAKQHKNYFHSRSIYVSLGLWPVLGFATSYFGFLSFELDASAVPALTAENLVAYLALGYVCQSFFRSLVQSAWMFSFERTGGTLELMYLSPASWQAMLLGNALSSLLESAVVMLVFGTGLLALNRAALDARLVPCMVVFVLVCVMAVLWGVLLNALSLFSRDSAILFTILEEPMEVFGGVKVPVGLMPLWCRVVGYAFPLAWALEAVRRVFLAGAGLWDIRGYLLAGGVCILVMYLLAVAALAAAGRHSRKTGNFVLF